MFYAGMVNIRRSFISCNLCDALHRGFRDFSSDQNRGGRQVCSVAEGIFSPRRQVVGLRIDKMSHCLRIS